MPGDEITRVADDARDFYGRNYWFTYQEHELGLPNIVERARADLPERCLHWLRTVLKYRQPPARILEVGSGHGAFVFLLQRAGYDATGLELSPWVVDYARRAFDVPIVLGRLEDQQFPPASFDAIVMLDVLEHLPDPVGTLGAAADRLHENGVLVIQTPRVPSEVCFEDMVSSGHPFLPMLRERGHLYLFTPGGLQLLLERVGLGSVVFEPAIFSQYDMFAVASRRPPPATSDATPAAALPTTPDARLVRALLDLEDRLREVAHRYHASEADRAARLEVITAQARQLTASEADRAARLDVITTQAQQLAASEADRAARLRIIEDQAEQLAAAATEKAFRLDLARALVERGRMARALRRLFGSASSSGAPVAGGSAAARDPHLSGPPAIQYRTLGEYTAAVDASTRSHPGLESIRLHQRRALDTLHAAVGLTGKAVLEVGASPHGHGLEHCLTLGVSTYTGIDEAVSAPVEVRCGGALGRLLAGPPASLALPPASLDVAVSLSFQRLAGHPAILRVIHDALRPGGVCFIHCLPLWTSSLGHGLAHLPEARLIPPWSHLVWTPEAMHRALAAHWPTTASMTLDEAISLVYDTPETARLDGERLRRLLGSSPFQIASLTPIRDADADDRTQLAACVAAALGGSADELMTLGYSCLLRKV
jgi:SAM-dependent methyltransferase